MELISSPNPKALILTHIAYNRNTGLPVEGPYSSIATAVTNIFGVPPQMLEMPLRSFEGPIVSGPFLSGRQIPFPKFLGQINAVKYFIDLTILFWATLIFVLKNGSRSLIIGSDALAALPAAILRRIFDFKLIFYCVDFSKNRFTNRLLQSFYERSDKISSQWSDQTWVVCESLVEYKKTNFGVDALYIPNSFPFDDSYLSKNKQERTGRRVVWTGSILTDKQITHIFRLCRAIKKIRPEIEFFFVPSNRHQDFEKAIIDSDLIGSAEVFDVPGQKESRAIVATCDLGLAIYDREHGSTKFIEPIKIWEYLMCGLPFIISQEPSLGSEIIKAGVALKLNPDNEIPGDGSLEKFVAAENLKSKSETCLKLAQEFDVTQTVRRALNLLGTKTQKGSLAQHPEA